MEYRACPNFPGFFASHCGSILRDNSGLPSTRRVRRQVLRVQKDGRVFVGSSRVEISRLVDDAWNITSYDPTGWHVKNEPDNWPRSSYPDGRIVTVAEFKRTLVIPPLPH
jgi:hypothetical protein